MHHSSIFTCHCLVMLTFACYVDDVRVRKETIRIDWAAYPHFKAPEVFAPFILDGRHLYYVNAFENAASTIETSAVAAENIARLILSRFFEKVGPNSLHLNVNSDRDASPLHVDL